MAKKYQDKEYVKKILNLNEKQLSRAEKKAKERHILEDWIFVRNAPNGQTTIYYHQQFIRWIKEVYLVHDKYYLDLEITFFENLIKEITNESNIEYKPPEYKDMSVKEMMWYFDKDYGSIRLAIYKMHHEYNSNLKYYDNERLLIKAEGIKWLNEKYYRISYLKFLEKTKLNLEGNKVF